jgi:hypothetical protein
LSFEVFVQCFEGGKPAGIPRADVRSLFPVEESRSEPDYWSVYYDDLNSCHISVSPLAADPQLLEALCVFRPCGDRRLWEALLAVLRLGSVALYFPGDAPPLVASEVAGEQLPVEMVEAMGQPRVVSSAEEIIEIIKSA